MPESLIGSPLAEVVRDRRINAILESIRDAVAHHRPLIIEPRDVDYIRRSFQRGLALGDRKLYELARSVLERHVPGRRVTLTLIVWGRCPRIEHENVVASETDLTAEPEQLLRITDTRLSEIHAPICPLCGAVTSVAASFVRHKPEIVPDPTLLFLVTRIKTTSNICYKIADMVFDIDTMFRRDKLHNEFGPIVTDVYGLKVVMAKPEQIAAMADCFIRMPETDLVEEKDYTGVNRKRSGYEAYKLVIRREKHLFEVQIQSLGMFTTEQTSRTASHRTYRERQTAERRRLGKEYVEVFRALSQLFATPDENFCSIDYIEIGQTSKGADDEF
jgi:ppGpp synthetase/RelA/SpoT-type nucleotidyltranferase